MEVKEFQNQIVGFLKKWDKKRGFTPNERAVFTHLVEEVGELASQYVNEDQRKDQYKPKEVENAIGDVIIQAVRLADLRGLAAEEIVTKIMKEEKELLNE